MFPCFPGVRTNSGSQGHYTLGFNFAPGLGSQQAEGVGEKDAPLSQGGGR